jgi:hypothetical protein
VPIWDPRVGGLGRNRASYRLRSLRARRCPRDLSHRQKADPYTKNLSGKEAIPKSRFAFVACEEKDNA